MPDRDPIDVAISQCAARVGVAASHMRGVDRHNEIMTALRNLVAAVGKTEAEERVLAAHVRVDAALTEWLDSDDPGDGPEWLRVLRSQDEREAAVVAFLREREGQR